MKRVSGLVFLIALAGTAVSAGAATQELDAMLEANAIHAAYARICDEEPMAEQIKVDTMLLLTTQGVQAQDVRLGNAKFNQLVLRQIAATKNASSVNCQQRMAQARERLAEMRRTIEAGPLAK